MAFANMEALRIDKDKSNDSGVMCLITSILFFVFFTISIVMKKNKPAKLFKIRSNESSNDNLDDYSPHSDEIKEQKLDYEHNDNYQDHDNENTMNEGHSISHSEIDKNIEMKLLPSEQLKDSFMGEHDNCFVKKENWPEEKLLKNSS
eukprot:CAMPEP_0170521572 /NCGR_PEP_ID=MMETSP0209-20121228/6963_1 /TAXON_ID=665100 ORGANISM="Litonotus pictus, Strain P1" /NCGR_SAMPLE_ID=MMETSP0209 /ASSEMBLY_ACC=CAM_ASM_000301 /LENGTH=146 /DNA_ID=CAMNT_0010808537 /DNA_START=20 /DNA_END=460 /DNA_ORIENTATION=-